jgi:hypothetical protein
MQSVIMLIVVAPKELNLIVNASDKSSEQAYCDKTVTVHGQTWTETDRQIDREERQIDRQTVRHSDDEQKDRRTREREREGQFKNWLKPRTSKPVI